MKKIISFVLFLLLAACGALQAKTALEITGAAGFIDPKDFNAEFAEGYNSIASPSIPLNAKGEFKSKLYDASVYGKLFMSDDFAVKLGFSYLNPEITTVLKASPSKTLRSTVSVPAGYLGLGADYYFGIFPAFSIIAGADAGAMMQLAVNYKIDKLDGTGYSGSGFSFGSSAGIAGQVKLGAEYVIADVLGINIFGGYRYALLPVKYPDKEPFSFKDTSGRLIFENDKLDLSGPVAGAGITLYSGAVAQDEEPEDKKATVRMLQDRNAKKSELEKFTLLPGMMNIFRPVYKTGLELFVSNGAGKPAQKPSAPRKKDIALFATAGTVEKFKAAPPALKKPAVGPLYTRSSYGAFVDVKKDKKRWFAFDVTEKGAAEVVWQLSEMPFNGTVDNWKNPPGLLKSGSVAASIGEFSLDFEEAAKQRVMKLEAAGIKKKTGRKIYYVRAVPVDSAGKPVAEPGTGLAVTTGEARVSTAAGPAQYELWTPLKNIGEYNGEFQDRPKLNPEVYVDPTNSDGKRLFFFNGLKATQGTLVIQVSDKPFGSGSEPPLYEKQLTLPVTKDELPSYFPLDQYPNTVVVPFEEFGKKEGEVKKNEYDIYYVRGLVLKPSAAQGTTEAERTGTVRVRYGTGDSGFTWYATPAPTYKYVDRSLPKIRMKSYTPVKWQEPDSFSHYYVYRTPTANEITCRWKNSNNETLRTYLFPDDIAWYKNHGIYSAQDYEQKVIPRFLKPGTKVYFPPPKEEDKEWYEELYEGIAEFFSDLGSAFSALVNQVADSYNNLKAGLINAVVNLCPVGDPFKGYFKTALEGMVNYGLVAVGLPPTLPNFDDLSSMSMDYLAETALTEAGIPANEITEAVVKEVAKGIAEQVQQSAARPAPNPIGAPFLKLDPDYLYRPAYIEVEFSNNSEYKTVGGEFDIAVTFEFDYWTMYATNYNPAGGILFTYPNPYAVGSAASITRSLEYMEHFLYGLNGYTVDFKQGEKAVYEVFVPVVDKTAPVLQPHETRTVRIYLDEAPGSFTRYPDGEAILPYDFEVMYFGNGNKQFTNFYLTGVFPSTKEFMYNETGYINYEANTEYLYRTGGPTSDTAEKYPVSQGWNR